MRVQAAILIEDRDTSWLFTDVENAHPDADLITVVLPDGLSLDASQDEFLWQWAVQWENPGNEYRVVQNIGPVPVDFLVVPTPIVVNSLSEYEEIKR